ncbi:MAG: hypothetical protein KF729_12620 [Sandaracinaceae bacterium]|nr:hypothetical protein [Sandaracinaceae bacterium]
MPRVAITGMGAVSALGADLDALRAALLAGADGIAPITRWDASDLAVRIAAHVRAPLAIPEGWSRGEAYAVAAACEAWTRSGCAAPPGRVALVLGTMAEIGGRVEAYAERVAEALAIGGPRLTVSTACTSGVNAIGLARDLLLDGDCDAVIAGGVDELTKELFAGFAALGVLSHGPCAPFSSPEGTTLGEGAGFVVLERDRAGAAYVAGYGLSADAYHATTPDPRGAGVERAMRSALADAALPPAAIGYVSAHGTGTASNDEAEWQAVSRVLGAPPISGPKSQLGHAQGAAGPLELIATLLAAEQGVLLPTLRFGAPRPRGPRDPIGAPRPRPGRFEAALCASSAFGGANCSVIVHTEPAGSPSAPPRPVYLAGHASAGEAPVPLDARLDGLGALRRLAPHVDPRSTDPGGRALIAAVALALGAPPRGEARDRVGLFLGASRVSPESVARYRDSIAARGHAYVDTAAFARVILSAPASMASLAHGLRGPLCAVAAGPASGLVALANAASHLARRPELERMLAAGLDEAPERGPVAAACTVLSAAPCARARGRLNGRALTPARPRRPALARAAIREPDHTVVGEPTDALGSFASAGLAPRAAARLDRAGASALALAEGDGAGAAVVLVREEER